MNSTNLLTFKTRVLPVVALQELSCALPMAQALLDGGVDAIEITLRTPVALDAITLLARELPAMQVGAGTVLTANDLQRVERAGAQFALSPGATPGLLRAAQRSGIPFIPGVASASEAMAARDHGFHLQKFFPAESLGGPAILHALAGPLQDIRFCPTGGLTAANVTSYLALANVAFVGGSWLAPQSAMRRQDWKHITQMAREATNR